MLEKESLNEKGKLDCFDNEIHIARVALGTPSASPRFSSRGQMRRLRWMSMARRSSGRMGRPPSSLSLHSVRRYTS